MLKVICKTLKFCLIVSSMLCIPYVYNQNLLTNGTYESSATTGWTTTNGGDGFALESDGHSGAKSLAGSYDWGSQTQTIDLVAAGYSTADLDAAPSIVVSEWYKTCSVSNDYYYYKAELLNGALGVITSFSLGSQAAPITTTTSWQQVTNTFSGYGAGVRYVKITHGSKDAEFWAGQYGALIDDSEVTLSIPMAISSSTVVQSSSSSISNCSSNVQIVCLQIVTTGTSSAKSVTQIQTNLTGTAVAGNISSSKIYYTGTSSTFATTTLFGTGTISASTYNIDGTQTLSTGTNYFWLVYNLNNTGTVGTTLDAIISQYTASAANYTDMSTTNPAGTRAITLCIAPGGIYTGLETWMKADAGITGTTPITAITNQNTLGTAVLVHGSPNLNNTATTYNYNPYIDLTAPVATLSDGLAATRQFLQLSGYSGMLGLNYTSLFWTFNVTDLTRTNTHLATVENVTNGSPGNGTLHGGVNGGVAAIFENGYDDTDFGSGSPAGTWQRNGTNITYATTHTTTKQIISANCTTGQSTTLNTFFGGQRDQVDPNSFAGNPRDCKGPAAELIGYTTSITATERQKIHSYLAIKYGITLSTNYLSTAGATTFTTSAPYTSNIIGLGRDDTEELYQKQTHNDDDSVRFYLSTLAATNIANTGTMSSDISYFVSGANTGRLQSTPASTAEMPAACGLYHRLEREWKITKTNFSESVNMNVKLNVNANPASVTVANLYLLVDTDGDFSNGGTTCYTNGDGSGIVFTYSNPLITISGLSSTHIANNTTAYITIGSINSATTLPIELSSFTGENTGTKNKLKWTTATELNNDYFTIEKTVDGNDFEIVGTQDGAGNSNQLNEYSLLDNNVRSVINYYRLKQTDFDGKFSYSNLISIDNTTANENSKEIILITNILGQEVNQYYRGLVIILYSDGTSVKILQ